MNTLTIEQMKSLVEACTYKPGWEIIFDNDGERPLCTDRSYNAL